MSECRWCCVLRRDFFVLEILFGESSIKMGEASKGLMIGALVVVSFLTFLVSSKAESPSKTFNGSPKGLE